MQNSKFLQIFGFKQQDNSMVWDYREDLLLLLVFFIQNQIFQSTFYDKILSKYNLNTKSMSPPSPSHKGQLDIITILMLRHGINIQMTALTMCILLQPPSTKGLIFLVFFCMIFVTKVMVDKEDKALRIMSWFWPLLVVYSLGVVVLRYVF